MWAEGSAARNARSTGVACTTSPSELSFTTSMRLTRSGLSRSGIAPRRAIQMLLQCLVEHRHASPIRIQRPADDPDINRAVVNDIIRVRGAGLVGIDPVGMLIKVDACDDETIGLERRAERNHG